MISRFLVLIWLLCCVFAQDDGSPVWVETPFTTGWYTFTSDTATATATSTPNSSSDQSLESVASAASHAATIRIIIAVVTFIITVPILFLIRKYIRDGHVFSAPMIPERSILDDIRHRGIAELPQGGCHETTELMAQGSPGEMGSGGHHETVEMEGSSAQPKEMAATVSKSTKWGVTSPEIQGLEGTERERKRGSMEILPC